MSTYICMWVCMYINGLLAGFAFLALLISYNSRNTKTTKGTAHAQGALGYQQNHYHYHYQHNNDDDDYSSFVPSVVCSVFIKIVQQAIK